MTLTAARGFIGLWILALTLAAFLLRGLQYALIGSWWPLSFTALILAGFAFSYWRGGRIWRVAVRAWGIFLILYGLARLAMAALIRADPGVSAHGADSTDLAYLLWSLLYLVAGFFLTIRPPRLLATQSR